MMVKYNSNGGVIRRASSSAVLEKQKRDDNNKTLATSVGGAAAHPRVFWRSETSLSEDENSGILSSDSSSSFFPSSLSSSPIGVVVVNANSSKAEQLRQQNNKLLEIPVSQQESYTVVLTNDAPAVITRSRKTRNSDHDNDVLASDEIYVDVDLEKYMLNREMTPLQERWNALTMIPSPLYCIVFVLSGNWMSQPLIAQSMRELEQQQQQQQRQQHYYDDMCMDWSNNNSILGWLFQNLHALPPLPVLAVVIGVVLHFPFSFVYHWWYAHALPATMRSTHWSRRMDQSMIHLSSALTSYATSGSWTFFSVNALFNADCIYRQFQIKVRPQRNQARLGAAIAAWTLPVFMRREWDVFSQLTFVLAIALYLFVKYPIGGWSHVAFHLFLVPLMPLLMQVALNLSSSQVYLQETAHCFAMAELRAS